MTRYKVFLVESSNGMIVPAGEFEARDASEAEMKARKEYRGLLKRMETHRWELRVQLTGSGKDRR